MKNISYKLLLSLFVCFALGSCKKDKEAFDPKLLMNTQELAVGSKASHYTFDALSNQTMQVEADVDWIILDTSAYEKGKRKIGFSVAANEDEERSGTIAVRISETQTEQVQVIQESGIVPTFFVTADGTGDGASWETATDLQTAIDKAVTGSIIYLAEGTYKPSKTIRNGSASETSDYTFELAKHISLIGGFAADAKPGDSPDPDRYKTILDGELSAGIRVDLRT